MKQNHHSRGSVLIISLIMLSVVTMMVVAYLSFARFELASVSMSTAQTESRFKINNAYTAALADIGQRLATDENLQAFVSTVPITKRAPVMFDTNGDGTNDVENFYLDLNRNGQFETNGLPNLGARMMGDPEWIGVLNDSSLGPKNRFDYRYAYMVIPAHKTLDLNHIHNKDMATGFSADGYWRGTGNASWDINLAGLLNALDPNMWTYGNYTGQSPAFGTAFGQSYGIYKDRGVDRVTGLHAYRYNYYYAPGMVSVAGGNPGYGSHIPLGAPNGRAFHDIFNLLNGRPTVDVRLNNYEFFTSQLLQSGPNAFYQLAGSISTITQPIPTGKLDLNAFFPLVNVVSNFLAANNALECRLPHSLATGTTVNFLDFGSTPLQFRLSSGGSLLTMPQNQILLLDVVDFNNRPLVQLRRFSDGQLLYLEKLPSGAPAPNWVLDRSGSMFKEVAARLLQLPPNLYTVNPMGMIDGFDIPTNDPQFGMTPNNLRLLQLAANIVDAYSANAYPAVFHPQTERDGVNIRIKNFVREPNSAFLATFGGLSNPTDYLFNGEKREVPLVIGVHKRFGAGTTTPSLGEISVQAILRIGQSLNPNGTVKLTAQPQIILNAEAFNPAQGTFDHSIVKANVKGTFYLNSTAVPFNLPVSLIRGQVTTLPATWTLSTGAINASSPVGIPSRRPAWKVEIDEVELRYVLSNNGNLLDHVHVHLLNNEKIVIPQVTNIKSGGRAWQAGTDYKTGDWVSILVGGFAVGHYARVDHFSGNVVTPDMRMWRSEYWTPNTDYKVGDFVRGGWATADGGWEEYFYFANSNHRSAATFSTAEASKSWFIYNGESREISWQTRDPLVNNHEWNYTPLLLPAILPQGNFLLHPAFPTPPRQDVGPNAIHAESLANPSYGPGCKDPGVTHINWQFAAGPLGNVGWLGAIHRGTPWQTVHFKSSIYGQVEVVSAGAPEIFNTVEYLPFRDGDSVDITTVQDGVTNNIPTAAFVRVMGPNRVGLYYSKTDAQGIDAQGFALSPRPVPDRAVDISVLNPGPNQTKGKVFLRSIQPWTRWAGATDTHPANDFQLADLFEARPYFETKGGNLTVSIEPRSGILHQIPVPKLAVTDPPPADGRLLGYAPASKGLLSVNQTYPAAWSAVLSAIGTSSGYTSPNDGKLPQIINGINSHRSLFFGKKSFPTRGEILKVPQLTDASPYLIAGATDADYERIPAQLLSILRDDDEPIFVIYTFVQSLKPAQGAIDPATGDCANYSVKGELSTRTVVRQTNWRQVKAAQASNQKLPPRFQIVNQIPMTVTSSSGTANSIPLSYR